MDLDDEEEEEEEEEEEGVGVRGAVGQASASVRSLSHAQTLIEG